MVADSGPDDLDALYSLAGVWASWIQAHRKDWNAVAELSRVEAILKRTVELDPEYENGQPYLYLGALATMLPPALGGKPEEGRAYFEKAIEISGGNNLYAKFLYAQRYARLVFDRQLHDRLLNEVLEARPHAEGYRLANAIAKQKAEKTPENRRRLFLKGGQYDAIQNRSFQSVHCCVRFLSRHAFSRQGDRFLKSGRCPRKVPSGWKSCGRARNPSSRRPKAGSSSSSIPAA